MAISFEWDPRKDAENQRKHGVSFTEAEIAFLDPRRLIFRDSSHGDVEERFYCLGTVTDRVLTVRFTYRGDNVRIIGAGYWRRGRKLYEAQRRIYQ